MSNDTTFIYTYTDPRYFDGDEFEVAAKAVEQAEESVRRAATAVEDANVMARNAEMTRNLWAGGDSRGNEWPESPQGKGFLDVAARLGFVLRRLAILKAAAGFNPRNPPKA